MDNVLVDFTSGIKQLTDSQLVEYENNYDEVPGIFALMAPNYKAIESFNLLCDHFDVYILSTAPWNNPSAWSDKLLWVVQHLGKTAYKRLILTHHKNLNAGDYLIDDRTKNGADRFAGEHVLFGGKRFPDWITVVNYIFKKEGIDIKIESPFDSVSVDADTQITHQNECLVGTCPALFQAWRWDGVAGESLIFLESDIGHLDEDELKSLARQSGRITSNTVTISRNRKGFGFVNFNFKSL